MTSKPTHAARTAGTVAAIVLPIVLMLWAAAETSGALRWALLGWVVLVVLVYIWNGTKATQP